MALVPHKIVALNELNEGAKNTISGAVVSLFDSNGAAVTLFDDEAGSNGSTAKQTDSEGVVVVYVTPGEYDEQVNGGIQRRVLVGNKEITTEQLIERIRKARDGNVLTTTGFYAAGDAGGAQWKATSTTGLTPSQSPADRGAAELVDGSGRLWVLVVDDGSGKALGDLETSPAPKASRITVKPEYADGEGNILTAFDGDFSRCDGKDHRVEGAATIGQPTTGYEYFPPACAHYTTLFTTSGHNEADGRNDGRTGLPVYRVKIDHNGQGDAVAYNASVVVRNNKATATNFLANPGGVLFNGSVFGAVDGVFLNPREIGMDDQGFDVAAIGDVVKGKRTNDTAALGEWWAGYRVQTGSSTVPWDVGFSMAGSYNYGLDMTYCDFGVTQAAITLKEGHRIYFNATGGDSQQRFPTATPNNYMVYEGGVFKVVISNQAVLQLNSTSAVFTKPVDTTEQYRVDGQRVVSNRQAAIADSVGGDEQAKINLILAALRSHGLIEV